MGLAHACLTRASGPVSRPTLPPKKLMDFPSAGAWLPASLFPAAWNAFKAVVSDSKWTVRIHRAEPLLCGVEGDACFSDFLENAGAFRFDVQARQIIAARLQAAAASLQLRHLKSLHLDPVAINADPVALAKAEARLTSYLTNRIRSEIDQALDARPEPWSERAAEALKALSPEDEHAARRYLGLDQRVSDREIKKALNYVFKSMELRMPAGKRQLYGQQHKMDAVRTAREHADPSTRARNLVLRALDALVSEARGLDDGVGFGPELLQDLETLVRARFEKDGGWGLIDMVIAADRAGLAMRLPRSPEVLALMEEQNRRLPDLRGLIVLSKSSAAA